jgi:hypothetical protein
MYKHKAAHLSRMPGATCPPYGRMAKASCLLSPRLNPINIPSLSPTEAQKIIELTHIYGNLPLDRILTIYRAMVGDGCSPAPTPTPPSQMHNGPG